MPDVTTTIVDSKVLGIAGIAASIASSWFFYVLATRRARRYANLIANEKARQARDQLLGMLESYLIEKRTIPADSIQDRIIAVQRHHGVDLASSTTPESLLQDIALRIDDARYLTAQQKLEYSEIIGSALQGVRRGPQPQAEVETPDLLLRHFRFTSLGLFFWFWVYNGFVGFVPLISADFIPRYHWYIFGIGLLINLSYLFSPYRPLPVPGSALRGERRPISNVVTPPKENPESRVGSGGA